MNAIGFIGGGKCGMSLAYYFRDKGLNVTGFSSRHDNKEDFNFLSRNALVEQSDIIFITVTDSAISQVWERIKNMNLDNKIICHCSGSLSSEVFSGAVNCCSVHPLFAFNSNHTSGISNAVFTIEGSDKAVDKISKILSVCGNSYKRITSENKVKYHAAACFASNFVVSVCKKAFDLMNECGFSDEESRRALTPLIRNNIDNILSVGCEKAITGPAIRGDILTIENHLEVLDEKTSKLYKELTDVICEMKEKTD